MIKNEWLILAALNLGLWLGVGLGKVGTMTTSSLITWYDPWTICILAIGLPTFLGFMAGRKFDK